MINKDFRGPRKETLVVAYSPGENKLGHGQIFMMFSKISMHKLTFKTF